MRRTGITLAAAMSALVLAPTAAYACGGLVGENGAIELLRTTTLAAYSDGVERYVTAFEFSGEGESVGSIVPLPDVPTSVERGGDWTLQRLALEVAPPVTDDGASFAAEAEDRGGVEIILETEIDALDITVLSGGGDEVGRWALDNGFFLPPDAPEMLDFYAERSPVFMAAKFDAARAAELGQATGDSTPIMATIPTDDPWVPLRILSLGLDESRTVEADVFLLTDERPELLAGGPGMKVERSEPASSGLLADLRFDVGMEWVPSSMWLSYLQLDVTAGDLDYDLAVAAQPGAEPSLIDAGVGAAAAVPVQRDSAGLPRWPILLGAVAGMAAFLTVTAISRRRLVPGAPAAP
ncbi:MAG TPA: DUF2330 domain-containing protein [Egibacteraceae bacterium]|nr:DUF2330 domain-containing protein [Egibacteraceae bacterium]